MAVKRHRTHYDVTAENRTDAAMGAVERNMKRVDGAAAAMGNTFRTVLGATAAIAFGREIGRAAIEAEKSGNRLTAVLRATGGVAGVTRREIEALAESLSGSTMFDDDAIRNAATELAKFGNIHGNVFREGLALSADLASFMGTEIPNAAQMVGRALQSPTEGLRLLERQFGRLTEEEEKHIETLAAQGDAVGAQNAVLELLRRKIGDTAEEMNTGLTKATSDFGKAWDDALEAIGRSPAVTGTATSGLEVLTDQLRALKRVVEEGNWVELIFGSKVSGLVGGGRPLNVATGRIKTIEQQGIETAMALEAGLAATPRVPVVLGGRVKPGAAGAGSRLTGEYGSPEGRMLAAEMALGAEAERGAALVEEENAKRRKKSIEEITRALVESAEVASERNENTVYTYDRLGNRIEITREAFDELANSEQRAIDAAQEFGFTATSAFEDMVLEGGKARDVIQGLGKDIMRIVLRKTVTGPMAQAISSINWAGVFGGARAAGGPVSAGRSYLVGEDGPELFMPGSSGQIVPNGAVGGVTIHMPIHFSANTPAAVRDAVFAMMPTIMGQARMAVSEARARGAG